MPDETTNPNEEMQVSAINRVEEEIPVPAPSPSPMPSQQMSMSPSAEMPMMPAAPALGYDEMQSVVEEIIDEKWKELLTSMGDITTWKVQVEDDLEAAKQEILRLQSRFDTVQAAVVGKVGEYEGSMRDLSTDMKALEQVMQKILEPLTANIKELNRIVEDLRERKK
ncbi:MAG TPA: hypothetical protein HA362_01555 [Nanoarchaeota archaeon]|nr:hypothetical protein [Nanoarchaeota archaeon]